MPERPSERWSGRSRREFLRRCFLTGSILAVGPPAALSRTSIGAGAQQADDGLPLLVDSAWLNEQISTNAPGMVLLDLGDLEDYRDGHLPGAVHSYWLETVERDYPFYGTVLNQWDAETGLQEEDQGKRIAWMRRYGIGPDTHVVAYDHGDGRRAARIVWFLHFLGHGQASMLDGGMTAWRQHGLDVASGEIDPAEPTSEPAVSPQTGYYVATIELELALTEPQTQLIDIRTEDERRDTVDGRFPTGVIPGSLHVPWTGALGADGRLLDPDALRTWSRDAGIDSRRRVILYGRFGSDTNLMWLALRLAGYAGVEVYDRGWVEWASTSGLPVEPLP